MPITFSNLTAVAKLYLKQSEALALININTKTLSKRAPFKLNVDAKNQIAGMLTHFKK